MSYDRILLGSETVRTGRRTSPRDPNNMSRQRCKRVAACSARKVGRKLSAQSSLTETQIDPNKTMKLLSLAFLVGPTVISAENERNLSQQDAADRVSLAVKSAMSSGVHGVAMPLNYVKLSEQFGGEQQLAVALRLPGVDEDQNMLIDTGSSALAFCNSSLATEATDITKTDYAKCNAYGTGVCPDGSSGGSLGWVGPVYQGDVTAYDISTEEEVAAMEDVYFTIMEEQFNFYSCDGPLDGTIGVAYTSLNTATALPSTNFNASDLMNFLCIEEGVLQCSGEYGSTPLPAVLEQSLSEDVESGYNAQEAFGLYLDYVATVAAEPDTILPGVGAYFGGNQALDNEFYNLGTPHVSLVFFYYHTHTLYFVLGIVWIV